MSKKKHGRIPFLLLPGILAFILVILFFASFMITYPITAATVWDVLRSSFMDVTPYWESAAEKVIFQARIPRILLAILTGGTLAVSGASYQTLFKNPMISPDLLGVSAGAGFGAALAMIFDGTWSQIQLSALFFGLLAVAIAYGLGSACGKSQITTLVLAGVITSSLFQALLSVVKAYADTDSQLPSITFRLMGSLGKGDMQDVSLMLPATILCLAVLFLLRNHLDVLSAGEEEASALGVNVRLVSAAVILTSTLMTVISVSICGMIGCQSSAPKETTAAETTAAQTTAEETTAAETTAETEKAAESSDTVTVTDMDGRKVTLPAQINSIATFGSIGVINAFVELMGYGDKICNDMTANFTKSDKWAIQYEFAPQIKGAPVLQNTDGEIQM